MRRTALPSRCTGNSGTATRPAGASLAAKTENILGQRAVGHIAHQMDKPLVDAATHVTEASQGAEEMLAQTTSFG